VTDDLINYTGLVVAAIQIPIFWDISRSDFDGLAATAPQYLNLGITSLLPEN
jgi:hypothetical protein